MQQHRILQASSNPGPPTVRCFPGTACNQPHGTTMQCPCAQQAIMCSNGQYYLQYHQARGAVTGLAPTALTVLPSVYCIVDIQ